MYNSNLTEVKACVENISDVINILDTIQTRVMENITPTNVAKGDKIEFIIQDAIEKISKVNHDHT